MKLPSLDDLNLDDDLDEFMDEPENKRKAQKTTNKSNHKKSEEAKENEVPRRESDKPKIPKTEYDAEGNPVLSIPDLDDVDLTKELDRFFD